MGSNRHLLPSVEVFRRVTGAALPYTIAQMKALGSIFGNPIGVAYRAISVGVLAGIVVSPALAAADALAASSEATFIAAILVILLGPSLFGLIWPQTQHALFPPDATQKAMLAGIAQFGVLLLLLVTGMD